MASRFRADIAELRSLYGKPAPPFSTDPFELVVYENIAYLASDEKRGDAFAALRRDVGVTPRAILKAKMAALVGACRVGGIYPERRAERLRRCAEIVVSRFEGDLRSVLRLPYEEARKALQRFPAIGEPGADKILLFSGGRGARIERAARARPFGLRPRRIFLWRNVPCRARVGRERRRPEPPLSDRRTFTAAPARTRTMPPYAARMSGVPTSRALRLLQRDVRRATAVGSSLPKGEVRAAGSGRRAAIQPHPEPTTTRA
jgi:hypothetical protein